MLEWKSCSPGICSAIWSVWGYSLLILLLWTLYSYTTVFPWNCWEESSFILHSSNQIIKEDISGNQVVSFMQFMNVNLPVPLMECHTFLTFFFFSFWLMKLSVLLLKERCKNKSLRLKQHLNSLFILTFRKFWIKRKLNTKIRNSKLALLFFLKKPSGQSVSFLWFPQALTRSPIAIISQFFPIKDKKIMTRKFAASKTISQCIQVEGLLCHNLEKKKKFWKII